MTNPARRLAPALLVASLTLAGAAAARGDDEKKVPDDYKVDLRKLVSADSSTDAKVGDAFLEEKDETEKRAMHESDEAGTELSSDEETTELHYECVRLLVAQDKKARTDHVQYAYRAWRWKKNGEEDTSLRGKVVVVHGAGERRTFVIVTPDGARAKVSDEALAWVRKQHTKKISSQDMKKLDRLAPDEPVAPEGEWTADPKILSEAIFESAPIDAERSSVKGKLTKVRVEDGAIHGTISLDMKLLLLGVPGAKVEWVDGALAEVVFERDSALESGKPARADERGRMHMKGKVRVETGGGARVREIEVTGDTRTKVRAADAPAVVALRFDPEADWRWNVSEWAASDEPGAAPEVGDRSFFELETTNTSLVKVNGRKTSDKKSALSSRVEVEVTAVAEKKVTESKATIVRWRVTADDETDECLEGKTVLVARAKGAEKPTFKVLDEKGMKVKLTDSAKKFIETELLTPRTRGMQLDNLQELLGAEPVVPGKEVGIDPEKALKKVFGDGQELDADTSKANALLKDVKVVAGEHRGRLEARLLLKLTTVPGAPGARFDEPGTVDLTFGYEGSLDRPRTGLGTATFKMDYFGEGTVNGNRFEPKVVTTRSIRSGVLPKTKKVDDDWK